MKFVVVFYLSAVNDINAVRYVENNTWARGDMKFIFECLIEHEKINFISPSSHVLFYL